MKGLIQIAPVAALIAATGCASTTGTTGTTTVAGPRTPDIMSQFGQPSIAGAALARLVREAAAHPLGSARNPVRAEMPGGQRAYLARLRCQNGRAPTYARRGNVGPGVFGNIVDLYDVDCGAAAPGRVEVYMDMYHPRHEETATVPGFTIRARPIT